MKKTSLVVSFLFLTYIYGQKPKSIENQEPAQKDSVSIFKWQNDLCQYKGTYNNHKYTEELLQNSYTLVLLIEQPDYFENLDIWSIEDLKKSNLDDLKKQYTSKKTLYNKKIIPTPFWENLKQAKLQELENIYALQKTYMEAFSKPETLINSPFSKDCKEYVDVLCSKDTKKLLDAWRKLVNIQKANNVSPEKLEKKYMAEYSSKENLLYAKIELMNFGWYNCAVVSVKRPVDGFIAAAEFKKLFAHIDENCEY